MMRAFFAALVTCGLLLGCGHAPPEALNRITAFSTATQLAMNNTSQAFRTVEIKHSEMLAARVAADYDTKGFRPDIINPFLSPQELSARVQIFEALQAYAASLTLIMGTALVTEFDSATKQLGSSLATLDKDVTKRFYLSRNASFTDSQFAAFTTAVNALGRWLLESKREYDVKVAVNRMQLTIGNITKLMAEDIGSPPSSNTAGSGLRSVSNVGSGREI